jgi:hypothetical protein
VKTPDDGHLGPIRVESEGKYEMNECIVTVTLMCISNYHFALERFNAYQMRCCHIDFFVVITELVGLVTP